MPGLSCSKICSRLPLISAVWEVRPVIFAPGRFRLLTMPAPIGSPALVKTMGMVVVIRICCHRFSGQLRQAPHLSFGGAIVEDQILAFAIAKLIKPLCHNHRVLTAHESEVSYAVRLSRLLRAQRCNLVCWTSEGGAP